MREVKLKYFNAFTVLRDIIHNIWVIFLAAVIGFCGCQLYHGALAKTRYTSTMTVSVNLSGYTSEATVVTLARVIQITSAFQEVLQSPALVDILTGELGEPITGEITATQVNETNLINISVTDISPEKAYRTLTSVYKNYPKITDSVFNNVVISVISNPNMPSTWSNKRQLRNDSVRCAVIAAALCTLLIFVISYFRDTVKNVTDIEDMLNISVFGTAPHVNKRKSRIKKTNDGILLTNPLISSEYSEAFREMAIKLESLQRTKKIRSVAITSIAENEGKTTVGVNLAIALAELGKRVVLVDADMKLPAVYKFFDKNEAVPEKEFGDCIKGEIDDVMTVVRQDHRTGVYLACGQKGFSDSSELIQSKRFKDALGKLESKFDMVIVDTPPGGVAVDAEIMSENVSELLLVIRQDYVPVDVINDYLLNIDEENTLGCVFNDVTVLDGGFSFLKADYSL